MLAKYKSFVVIVLLNFLTSNLGQKIKIYGPGLQPKNIVMPARYFVVNFTSIDEYSYSRDLISNFAVEISGKSLKNNHCRVWANNLDRKDGTFIVRYKVYETCTELSISIYYKNKHIPDSPFKFEGPIQPDQCVCPEKDLDQWLKQYQCPLTYDQIEMDLKPFQNLVMKNQVQKIIKNYHKPESTSFCHYVIKNNEIYRDCYGKHVGFNMFADNILLSLTRKVVLPDMELVINLGDWPLVHKDSEPLPIFSWCGSNETLDIVMPTYDITESALENMGRVTLDTLSVQGNVERKWEDREDRAFWRGRDSRAERLKLIDIARAHPDLLNASLTNFFFFREKEAEYGPKLPHVSFFKFFDYKYQINVDGTVAAYRLPYLLSGGALVFKQDSPYYEHFYGKLKPYEHFVPIRRDLSDLPDKINWAKENDEMAHQIARNAQIFANSHLLPQHIICYHAVLFLEWSKRIKGEVKVGKDMTQVPQTKFECQCDTSVEVNHEEL
ncbi:protein O-glucosyltransferase 2-like [Vanessa cardui]|uniref:protein O-glucosyltransferase 2-like n=1 Tax=Vanessa cardui TaxID=171605 RepID=UPI001F1474BA|nr:protein O-glucosyltransferase 2-like [Vanessa cardui]